MRQKAARAFRALTAVFCLLAMVFFLRHLWLRGILDPWLPVAADSAGRGNAPGPKGEDITCADCHGEIEDLHLRGPHRSMVCEECHGPLESHVEDGVKIADMAPFRSITRLCSQCHRELNSRRVDAPRLNLEAHVIEVGALFSDRVCFDCHQAHDPRP
ncbi:hypothetical protein ACFL2P_03260 [Candidatus Moduliflexota bacterium]